MHYGLEKRGKLCHESYLCSTRKQVQVLRLRIPEKIKKTLIFSFWSSRATTKTQIKKHEANLFPFLNDCVKSANNLIRKIYDNCAELPIVLSSKSHIIWPKSAQIGAHFFLSKKCHNFWSPKQFLLHFYALIFLQMVNLSIFWSFSDFLEVFC